jgi:protein arginine kinase
MNVLISERISPQRCKWVLRAGEDRDVVVGTRVRLSRNIDPFPFPMMADERTRKKVVAKVGEALEGIRGMRFFLADELFCLELSLCAERFLIEDPLVDAIAVDEEEKRSVAVNYGDHVRIYGISGGLNIWNSWEWANSLDDEMGRSIGWAFSPELGYLTSSPTDVGTGMKISIILHIPAMVWEKRLGDLMRVLDEMDFELIPMMGDVEAKGSFFILSNKFTTGMKEEEIIERVERAVKGIVDMERGFRDSIRRKGLEPLIARIERAMNSVRRWKVMGETSSIEILSELRLGVAMGILKGIEMERLDETLIVSRPAHLQILGGGNISLSIVEVKRASFIRRRTSEARVEKGLM